MTDSDRSFGNEEAKKRDAEALFKQSIEHITGDEISSAAQFGQEKVRKLESSIPKTLQALWRELKLLVTMLRDYVAGNYRDIPFGSIAAIAAAVLYFISPVDAIPDFIPGIGYVDDAAVLMLCLRMVHRDVEDYQKWKETDNSTTS
ncbi:MAG: YkvA family protein [Bythopirellula sp.]